MRIVLYTTYSYELNELGMCCHAMIKIAGILVYILSFLFPIY